MGLTTGSSLKCLISLPICEGLGVYFLHFALLHEAVKSAVVVERFCGDNVAIIFSNFLQSLVWQMFHVITMVKISAGADGGPRSRV